MIPEFPTQQDELRACLANRGPIVFAEIGDGLEIRRKVASQPDQLWAFLHSLGQFRPFFEVDRN